MWQRQAILQILLRFVLTYLSSCSFTASTDIRSNKREKTWILLIVKGIVSNQITNNFSLGKLLQYLAVKSAGRFKV